MDLIDVLRVVRRCKAIAGACGREDYRLVNPEQRKPSLKSLPLKTQQAILDIKNSGTQPRFNSLSYGN